eukprot:scaffold412097_cov10-Prasinocladus_malaysianus.AAC.1
MTDDANTAETTAIRQAARQATAGAEAEVVQNFMHIHAHITYFLRAARSANSSSIWSTVLQTP